MKRYVSIWFPHLSTDWFELRQPELKQLAFVLVTASHGRMIISAANTQAQEKGVNAGMVLADSRAVLPALKYFDDKPGLVPQLLQRLAEWCIRFTPCAAVDPPGGIILDATGCSHLWGGDAAYVQDIVQRLADRGYTAKAAIADTIGAAWAMARFGKEMVIEKDKQADALLPLPPEALRIGEATAQRLQQLGLAAIKNIISIPRNSLRRRFGSLIVQRLNHAFGTEPEFIQPVYSTAPYQERLPCMEAIVTRNGIEIALQRLLEQLCTRLQKEGKGLRTVSFRGYRADSQVTGIQVATTRASHNIAHLFHLFQMKLEIMEPGPGIELFVLEASKVEPYAAVQEAFWKQADGFQNNKLSELIDRISGKMGADAVQRFLPEERWWPERSFKQAASLTEQPATVWKLDHPRPLQLLAPPEAVEVAAPIPDYPPMHFRHKGKLHKIVRADGPERVEQEWWIQEGEHRDYYAVEDDQGCRYWIFRSGHYDEEKKPQWYLHGFFA